MSLVGYNSNNEEDVDGSGYYASVEKDGFDSNGLISISWVNGNLELREYLKLYQDALRNTIICKNSNLNFEPIAATEFNFINSKASKFNASFLGIKHQGILHTFHGKNKTFAILKQEGISK
ncbi:MAG: hypothetical protein ABJN95_06950 [Maribacter sp.]|uniref:hypothetical protein n=1 Tax=Maribacter sp. TaxID=1897614 RepID=UPI00329747E7